MAADKAYEFFNKEIGLSCGLRIRTPQTLRDISKNEVSYILYHMSYVMILASLV